MKNILILLSFFVLTSISNGCGDGDNSNGHDVGGDSNTDADTDSDTDNDNDLDTDKDKDTDTDTDGDGDTHTDVVLPKQPMCVYNQAYQENWQADSIDTIVRDARNCYVLVDPFGDKEDADVTDSIPTLKKNGNVVGCYISSGTCEDWRDDFAQMKPHCVESAWGEWAGEYFVDQPRNNSALLNIMQARIDKMAAWGCDMVEFDNMDWAFDDEYRQEYGFEATAQDGIDYNNVLCDYTHSRGMLCMAKNTRRGATDFDGGTFESYRDEKDWWEHNHLKGFLDAGQPGIIVHYGESDCAGVYSAYQNNYGNTLSYICESTDTSAYVHFNE